MKMLSCALLGLLFLAPGMNAAELEAIPEELAREIASKLVEQAAKIESPKVKIDADIEKANGVHVPKKVGAILVPQKGLKESEELAAQFKQEPGASLGYLFLYKITPVVDGKKIDPARLPTVTISEDDGTQHTVHVLQLSARQLSDDDYRLYGFGKDAKPLIDAKFAEGASSAGLPAAIEVKEVNEATHEGKLVVTVFGKYQAAFQGAHTGE
jgi:hypothetical protein